MTANNYRRLGRRRILVAEDVEMNQFLARHMMESWGFEVDIAGNGKEALDLLQQKNYDLVLMDIQMPEMDGVEATQHIRSLTDSSKATIPIVALTANALKGDKERFLHAGMNDYLAKPFTEPNLFQIIADNLSNVTVNEKILPEHVVVTEIIVTSTLYDLSMVYGIAGGDDSFVRKMVQLFLDTIPPALEDMKRETIACNWVQVSKLAHKMKSTIDSMGITSLKETIRDIERNGKKMEEVESIPAKVNEVDIVMGACVEQVRKDFSS